MGLAVAVSGNRILAGTYAHRHPGGIPNVTRQNSFYIFEFAEGVWTQTGEEVAPPPREERFATEFGQALYLGGDTAIVGQFTEKFNFTTESLLIEYEFESVPEPSIALLQGTAFLVLMGLAARRRH